MVDKTEFRPYETELPDGIRHLHNCMYLVRFDLLRLPDPESTSAAVDQYEFRNPRTLTERGQADLFDKHRNAELRESIKEKTLMTPFICRWQKTDNGLVIQMVGGERRHRALDFLIRKKELVKAPDSARLNENLEYEYEYKPANQVYEYVMCQIYSCRNDIDALGLAYTENDCRVNQGPGHDIAMVMELRRYNASDEQIMATMSKDERWLRDTDRLIQGLQPTCLKDLIEDRIDREAALEILAIKNKYGDDIATKALTVAHEASEKDYKKQFAQLTRKLHDAQEEEEIAEGSLVDAQFHNDTLGEEEAQDTLDNAKAKVRRVVAEREETKPTTDKDHVRDGFRTITGTTASKPRSSTVLRAPKIQENYVDQLESLIRLGGRNKEEDYLASPDALNLAIKLCRGIMIGDTDCMEIVRLHYKRLSNNDIPNGDEEAGPPVIDLKEEEEE